VSDTGVQHDHPALRKSYRGYKEGGAVDHNYNWYDATPSKVAVPEDDNGHGIHCTGTVCGGKDGRKSKKEKN
jgi:bacillopeptidase F